jgi:enamine deaminase RidA (YjgF/YER057c/UK114 family)
MRIPGICFLIALCGATLLAQTQAIQPKGLAPGNGYSHVVVASPGKLAFIAGQVANNAQGQLVGRGDLKAQTEQVFENLKTALAAAGTSFEHVVKVTYFIKDHKPEYLPIVREVRNRYINQAAPPASTLVGVQSLFQRDYLIEVEAVAAVPERSSRPTASRIP